MSDRDRMLTKVTVHESTSLSGMCSLLLAGGVGKGSHGKPLCQYQKPGVYWTKGRLQRVRAGLCKLGLISKYDPPGG